MHTPTYVIIAPYSYPIGNTPPVCLTQDLPCEEAAKILLLGCGDPRNVLFTTYTDTKFDRELDITSCDNQTLVIARNVLLYALLLDDTDGSNHTAIWDVYYHFFINDAALQLVTLKAKELHALAASLPTWHSSKYGKALRFCDESSMQKVRALWGKLSISDLTNPQREDYDKAFKAHIKESNPNGGEGQVFSFLMKLHGFRTIAPADFDSMDEMADLYRYYWKYGTTDEDSTKVKAAVHSNPMFACLVGEKSMIYYSANPFLGFQLGNAYVPLSRTSPLLPKPATDSLSMAVEAARLQFKAWSTTFRKCVDTNMTLRFFVGDALTFCNTLEYKLSSRRSISANLYRGNYSFEPLVLDSVDYSPGGCAPLSFNVIDTSNLADHIGGINVLTAASPLLKKSISSTLYTETMAKQATTFKELISNTVCGDLPSVAVLFGLLPVQYYANASAVSTVDDTYVEMCTSSTEKTLERIMYSRLAWKRTILGAEKLGFVQSPLAVLLYKVYQEMFRGQNLTRLLIHKDNETIKSHEIPTYHRGSFAAMLRVVKANVVVDWDNFMVTLLNLIYSDASLRLTGHDFEELGVQLHILGLHTLPTMMKTHINEIRKKAPGGPFDDWADLPPLLCITLHVPRSNLSVFTRLSRREIATPQVHCVIKSADAKFMSNFCILQMSFGTISTLGARGGPDFQVFVSEDENGWSGDSDLIVSFYAPTILFLGKSGVTNVFFGLQDTTQTRATYDSLIGPDKILFNSVLSNQNNVYITVHQPGQSGYALTPRCPVPNLTHVSDAVSISMSAQIDPSVARVESFTGRIDFRSEEEKSLLLRGALVEITQVSPCAINVQLNLFNNKGAHHKLKFPSPVVCGRTKTRIARLSSWVEVVVRINLFSHGMGPPGFMYPLFLQRHGPVLMNMPHIDLQQLPILDVIKNEKLKWLITHLYFQFSCRERAVKCQVGLQMPENARVEFKKSLHSMFVGFSGLVNRKSINIFGVCSLLERRPYFIIFPSAIRVDLANRTIVLDAAILPVTEEFVEQNQDVAQALMKLDIHPIAANDSELALWQNAIPAWAERCRDWKHTESCEYKAKKAIPLTLEKGGSPICSCGNGIMPEKFITRTPKWTMVAKHAVRIAISPCFAAPYVAPVFTADEKKTASLALIPSCVVCGSVKNTEGYDLLTCECEKVLYCSMDCQKVDWPSHQLRCKK